MNLIDQYFVSSNIISHGLFIPHPSFTYIHKAVQRFCNGRKEFVFTSKK